MVNTNSANADASDTLQRGFRLADWTIEPLTSTFKRNGHTLHVEPKVMDVLVCLARNPGSVVTRNQLLEEVWTNLVVTDEVLTRCISELRTALGDTSRERLFIRTIPKRGYSLMVTVMPLHDGPESIANQPSSAPAPHPKGGVETVTDANTEHAAPNTPATPSLAREIINLVKSIVQAVTKVAVVTLALVFGIVFVVMLVALINGPDEKSSSPPAPPAPPPINDTINDYVQRKIEESLQNESTGTPATEADSRADKGADDDSERPK